MSSVYQSRHSNQVHQLTALSTSGGSAEPVLDLNRACVDKPVHLIIGEVHDAIPREVQDALVDPKSGRKFASVTRLKNIGHLVSFLAGCEDAWLLICHFRFPSKHRMLWDMPSSTF